MVDDGRVRVALACQGGGSHTAFTAGVLQRLLAEDRYDVVAMSGTSGGAVCALLAWYGLAQDDSDLASRLLGDFWADVAAVEPWDVWLNQSLVTAGRLEGAVLLPAVSPYTVPTWGRDRFRRMLADRVPAAVFAEPTDEPLLLIGAVDVRSGEFTSFSSAAADPHDRVSIDAVLASAAVPHLFRAMPVGDRLYWDGLFSQNPPVRDLFDAQPEEIWVIRINPQGACEAPKQWADIVDRRNELAGNLSLEQELYFVRKINEFVAAGHLKDTKYRRVRIEEVGIDRPLDLASKLDRTPAFLERLMAHGRAQAGRFLEQRGSSVPS